VLLNWQNWLISRRYAGKNETRIMPEVLTRKLLFRWMGWFALANALLLAVIGLRYFNGFTPGGTLLSWLYLGMVYPAHHVLLATVPFFLALTPIVLFLPSRKLLTVLAVVLFALMISIIMLDSLLWSQSRFHINGLTLQILGWQSWVFVGVIFLISLFFEFMLSTWVWRWVEKAPQLQGRLAIIISVSLILGSQFIHAWADASYYVPVTSVGMQLPVYKGFTAKRQLTRLGLVDPLQSREREIARRLAKQLDDRSGSVLNYPLNTIQCVNPQPMNVLLIMADAWRSDMLQEDISPFLWRYAQEESQWFTQHLSGGNSSRMGVFSLFYGLPPGYWSSFESLQRSAVLVDVMQEQGYQLGLFTSSTMYRPVTLDRTAFANVPSLRLRTEPADAPAWQRDLTMTQEWSSWLQKHDSRQPFFGFLLYDATNAQDYPDDVEPFQEVTGKTEGDLASRFSDYQKSIRFVDGLIESVVLELETMGLSQNTVVIITSDHGEEFDDSNLGLRDHGSGYTRYQLEVPMLVHWPGKSPRRFEHRTSHYDLVPTLMQDLLGCSNPVADYASGRNLFDETSWEWLLAGSYYNYAVLEPDQITVTYPNGRYEVRDWNYHIAKQPIIRGDVLESVSRENSRFYRK
jgi:membrane-anchored protein YejM (alkaline phosphatase superfamily)